MYIVWNRSWPLVILPCACIAAYMTFATVRYHPHLLPHARSTPLKLGRCSCKRASRSADL
jgi:hypothetical protein